MTRRILINLVVFSVLGVVMTIWALRNVIKFDAVTQPYQISAEFQSSPGLQPNFDVAYLGVKVGKIRSVRLGDHKIVANLAIDKGVKIPGNVTAAAGRKSAIGEPYVDLSPPPSAAGGPPLKPGAVIPLSRTSVAISYGDLFAAANKAVQGLNATDLHSFTHELAVGWDGRSQSLAQILDSSQQITSTFAENTELLDGLVAELTQVSNTLAAHHGELGSGLDNLTSFTGALARNSDKIAQLRKDAPDLLARFNQILAATAPANQCTLRSLSSALPIVLSQPALDSLEYATRTSPQLVKILNEISPKVNGKSNLNIDFVITLQKPKPAVEYPSPIPLPTVGAIPSCPGISVPPLATRADPNPGTGGARAAAGPAPSPSPSSVAVRNTSGQGPADALNWLIWIPPLIALAILIRVMSRTVPLLRPRVAQRLRAVRKRKNRGE
ncbi:MCE family protein [Actinomadura scrupuli]|uniref:MCE family protein n=1 Tax=Actinomadura scrupuli TaxID=559629 RepID=UPI003D9A0530